MSALGERTPAAASPGPCGLAAAGGKPASGGSIFQVEQQQQQQHRLGLSLLPEAAFGGVWLGQIPLPQVLPRSKVSVPLVPPEEALPAVDPSEAAIPPRSVPPLQTPSLGRSGAFSQMQPTPSICNKGTDKQAFKCNTVALQNQHYIPCPT